ncbi:MAG TPA: EAL domain-containing protein [Ktedonobacteraceae bacterium]|nr:EAL domain-containing protein [Ktedonobacteraceae bacterium]
MTQVEESLRFPQNVIMQQSDPHLRDETTNERAEAPTALRKLASSYEVLRAVITHAPIILFVLDSNGIVTFSEGQALQGLGRKPGSAVGASIFELYHDIPEVLSYICRALDGETFTAIAHMKDRIFETRYIPQFDVCDEVCEVIGVATDITERIKTEEALTASERKFRALIEEGTDLVFIISPSGVFRYASPSHQRLLGYEPESLIGRNVFELIHPKDKKNVHICWEAGFEGNGALARTQCRLLHVDGSWITVEAVGRNCFDDPEIQGFVVSARDITERIMMEEQLRYLALHDTITDLPNRAYLIEQMEQTLRATPPQAVTLLILNLNRFKDINDTFGHQQGDRLLRAVGERVKQACPDASVVARIGGDEFTIVLPEVGQEAVHKAVAALHSVMEEPFVVEEHPVQLDISIGGVFSPEHGREPITLLRKADIAMQKSKQAHLQFALYDASYEQNTARRLDLIRELRHAISGDEFRLYYQPKVEMKSGSVYGVEALIRWQHPTLGFIPPDQFISLAEQTGLIVPLTRWVLQAALRQCHDWIHDGIDLQIAVNLSMWDLRDPSLVSAIGDLLRHYHVPADHLRVELTESVAMTDPDHTLAVLKQLANAGVDSSIDDFGTGYSSLAYLKRLVANELKIDRSFVRHIAEETADATIVGSTVHMAHCLGLKVVAEGIEDEASMQLLNELDCDIAQGYFFARPLPPLELTQWLKERQKSMATASIATTITPESFTREPALS